MIYTLIFKKYGVYLLVALLGFGLTKLAIDRACNARLEKAELEFRKEIAEIIEDRNRTIAELREKSENIKVITKEVVREVPTYIASDGCTLSNSGLQEYNDTLEKIYSTTRQ